MIEVKNLSKRYGSVTAVKNLSFSVEKGEIVGFLGPNGAGKSTTMNIITGYLSPTAGSVSIAGYDILENPKEAKMHIGYLPEQPPLYTDMTVEEYLEFLFELKKVKFPKKPHIEEICNLVKISNVKNRLIKNLSKGYRQRVGFAAALIGNPEVLILDEPTVGFDPKQIIEIRNLIRLLGKNHTVILSSHILQEIQAVCERIIVINGGELVADAKPRDLAESLCDKKAIRVRLLRDKKPAETAISSFDFVSDFEFCGNLEDNTCDFLITPTDGEDIRSKLIKGFAEKNIDVLSVFPDTPSLEEVFLKLTSVQSVSEEETEKGENE